MPRAELPRRRGCELFRVEEPFQEGEADLLRLRSYLREGIGTATYGLNDGLVTVPERAGFGIDLVNSLGRARA